MYILTVNTCEDKKKVNEVIPIESEKAIKTLKIIYDTNIETIIMHDKEVIKEINRFFEIHNLKGKDKILVKMLLLTASIYNRIETVYQIVSKELAMSARAIKLKLVRIKNMLGYKFAHPDEFLETIVSDMGFDDTSIKVCAL